MQNNWDSYELGVRIAPANPGAHRAWQKENIYQWSEHIKRNQRTQKRQRGIPDDNVRAAVATTMHTNDRSKLYRSRYYDKIRRELKEVKRDHAGFGLPRKLMVDNELPLIKNKAAGDADTNAPPTKTQQAELLETKSPFVRRMHYTKHRRHRSRIRRGRKSENDKAAADDGDAESNNVTTSKSATSVPRPRNVLLHKKKNIDQVTVIKGKESKSRLKQSDANEGKSDNEGADKDASEKQNSADAEEKADAQNERPPNRRLVKPCVPRAKELSKQKLIKRSKKPLNYIYDNKERAARAAANAAKAAAGDQPPQPPKSTPVTGVIRDKQGRKIYQVTDCHGFRELAGKNGLTPVYLRHKMFGLIPPYLAKRRKQFERMKASQAAAERHQMNEGEKSRFIELAPEEKAKLLDLLYKKLAWFNEQYLRQSVVVDCKSKLDWKAHLEKHLSQIENDIDTIKRDNKILLVNSLGNDAAHIQGNVHQTSDTFTRVFAGSKAKGKDANAKVKKVI